jgi:hypothetical protein
VLTVICCSLNNNNYVMMVIKISAVVSFRSCLARLLRAEGFDFSVFFCEVLLGTYLENGSTREALMGPALFWVLPK